MRSCWVAQPRRPCNPARLLGVEESACRWCRNWPARRKRFTSSASKWLTHLCAYFNREDSCSSFLNVVKTLNHILFLESRVILHTDNDCAVFHCCLFICRRVYHLKPFWIKIHSDFLFRFVLYVYAACMYILIRIYYLYIYQILFSSGLSCISFHYLSLTASILTTLHHLWQIIPTMVIIKGIELYLTCVN